ncbi:sulfotransferase [Phaeocystidibacter luteus]|uniref:Sulfotransferase n=1 Tax=Phaeocystidibacter luteus TaxID=911197 RepID=A0A6N6RF39_9FLAO|nr:sulfotransferase [Phaeocystidibacter luteus]KAB2809777.1 sulfotransferase [Phaeocystidibacter luteus]
MRKVDILKEWWEHNVAFLSQLKHRAQIHGRIEDAQDVPMNVLETAPVFVLSTGRAGTMLLTRVFELIDGVEVFHEPYPDLLYAGKAAYQNSTNLEFAKGAFMGGRYELIRDSYIRNSRYIETNNRITFFAHAIAELFPNAVFIHLIRKPESFIASGLERGWYTGKSITDEGRIRPEDSSFDAWRTEDKLAWLWNETNHFCERFRSKYQDRTYFLKSEDLFSNPKALVDLLKWLNLTIPSTSELEKVIQKPVNSGGGRSKEISYNEKLTPLASKYY